MIQPRLPRNMRGAKWFNSLEYLSDSDIALVLAEVERAKETVKTFPDGDALARTIGVRAPAYIGEPHPIVSITYGPGGGSLFGSVYR